MANRNVSPGGALLRASRLFSIPAPIQRPSKDLAVAVTYNSDTGTLPHPTHLSITTPASSLSKGDWGLKRPLPLRTTTKTGTPLVRVNAIDTIEHVTDFSSSADHTLTLRKWQEMGVSLSTPAQRNTALMRNKLDVFNDTTKGVFEEKLTGTSDSTEPVEDDKRWRYNGPWLPGQTHGEFDNYLTKSVRKRKGEFREFLRQKKAAMDTAQVRAQAREKGEDVNVTVKASDITDEQLTEHIRHLRADRRILFALIRQFLDLPPAPSVQDPEDMFREVAQKFEAKDDNSKLEEFLPKSRSPYAESGPPRTHPSAGLSYLRSNAYVFNHPFYGPQAERPPVEARVVLPRAGGRGGAAPKLGVGGVVAEVPKETMFNKARLGLTPDPFDKKGFKGLDSIEPEKEGGSKIWVRPKNASIDSEGRINISIAAAGEAAVAIHQGAESDLQQHPSKRRVNLLQPLPPPATTTNSGYGLAPHRPVSGPNVFGAPEAVEDAEGRTNGEDGVADGSQPSETEQYDALTDLLPSKDSKDN